MPKLPGLAAVLRLREQLQTAEERALAALHAEAGAVRATMAQLSQTMQQHRAARFAETDQLLRAAHHADSALLWRQLRESQMGLQKQLDLLEQKIRAQQERFLHARRECELIGTLHEENERARLASQEAKERKGIDDLFLSRFKIRKERK